MTKHLMFAAATLCACATTPGPQPPPASNNNPPQIAREFRGVWIASVSNIDWPSRPGLPADSQKAELIAIFDKVQSLRMNAVILQVRPSADALYASELEPWSEYLTGKQGEPPTPYYDPLAFAIAEAHRRGLELHAWFNPYRARHPSMLGENAATHISKTRPDIARPYGRHIWMDPGEPEIRQRSLDVILDVVKRYDVDGIHIDDYFYPYQERDSANRIIPFPDDSSYARYTRAGGTLGRDDWRRSNVDALIDQLYRDTKKLKPWVKFGISPFGIWRPGNPPTIKGFDAYASLYADAKKWLNHGWLDYWTPQLYWQIAPPDQSYPVLLAWWIGENTKQRHIWAGNAPYRVRNDRQAWPPEEIVEQIRLTRAQSGASGNIHFSMRTLMRNQGGVADAMLNNSYTYFALPPRTPWLDAIAPAAPLVTFDSSRKTLLLRPGEGERPLWFAILLRIDGKWYAEAVSAEQKEYPLLRLPGVLPDRVVVTAVDRSGNESAAAAIDVR